MKYWNPDGYDRPLGWCAVDYNLATQSNSAFSHTHQAKRSIFRVDGRIEALAVILDLQNDIVTALIDGDFNARGLGMACDIGQRFLHDAKQRHGAYFIQAKRFADNP